MIENLASYIDHTLLSPDATKGDILRVVEEAKKYHTASVCVNSYWIKTVKEGLDGTDIKTCSVVGFPFGAMSTKGKVEESLQALEDGAEEIDMVLNIGELLDGHDDVVEEDIHALAEVVHQRKAALKVILETSYLDDDLIVKACKISEKAGADFVKTSTGYSSAGAKVEHVRLMRETVGNRLGVKASGGIHTKAECEAMIEAGANRLGLSRTVQILEEE